MFYNKSTSKELDRNLFLNPTSEYRGAPFWAWNTRLDKEKLKKQVHQFKEMRMGGFHIHCRVGLNTEYLSDEFFDCVKACEVEAKKEHLYCYLYDEDRWPSGSAGGIVTKEKKYRSRFLVFSPKGYKESSETSYMAAAKAVRSHDRLYLGAYEVKLDKYGFLADYHKTSSISGSDIWEAWLEISGDTPWFNNQAYLNTLDPEAVIQFIHVTHEKYYNRFGEDFGKEIKTIFTDEPQTTHMGVLENPFDKEQIIIPYTDDFDESFFCEYGYSILDHLPELFWEMKDQKNYQTRYHYHRHVTERFARAFGDQAGRWCREHDIGLTGHMMNEWTLHSQTMGVGEAMRPMKEFALPGVDMLCDRRELSTLKQAQSVARQQGREGVMCEIYGVTGWDFDFRNHKLAGDWQAALGVTFRVPHLTWVSMEGEAKRDYPACIGEHSPWYQEYGCIEDHFARIGTALTRGSAIVKVGVIHPIESYWMEYGNKVQTALSREIMEDNFSNIINWMLFGLIDFDFISEAMLAEEKFETGDKFVVGKSRYETVVIPECHTLRKETLSKLKSFRDNGGSVIFVGDVPGFVDGKLCDDVKKFAEECRCISYNRGRLLDALEQYRDIDVESTFLDGADSTRIKHIETGKRASNIFYQLRQDGENRWLFIAHVNKAVNEDIAYVERVKIMVNGKFTPVCYDTMSGEIYSISAAYDDERTYFTYDTSLQGSLLVKLIPGISQNADGKNTAYEILGEGKCLPEPTKYFLEEPNVYLLDQAEYAFDAEEWNDKEEILRIDNIFREKLNYPLRMEALAQPWTRRDEGKSEHVLKLRYRIQSEIKLKEIYLGMECPENSEIIWNNVKIEKIPRGYYVDDSIQKIKLPGLIKGENVLEIHMRFGVKTNAESMYILGDFGVRVIGREAVMTDLSDKIMYGDLTSQNLAFYGGNLIYETEEEFDAGELVLEISHYRGALMQIFVDEKQIDNLYLAPYRLSCGKISKGKHKVRIRLFGNRVNTFGAVHNADRSEKWYGPNIWRTTGNKWSYEYQLKQMGILKSPLYWIKMES